MPAFSQARLKRRRAASKISFSFIRTVGKLVSSLQGARILAIAHPHCNCLMYCQPLRKRINHEGTQPDRASHIGQRNSLSGVA